MEGSRGGVCDCVRSLHSKNTPKRELFIAKQNHLIFLMVSELALLYRLG